MKKNMGSVDRIVRLVLAIIMGWAYFAGKVQGTAGIILLVVAIVFVLTSLVSFCPLYSLLGICSNSKRAEKI